MRKARRLAPIARKPGEAPVLVAPRLDQEAPAARPVELEVRTALRPGPTAQGRFDLAGARRALEAHALAQATRCPGVLHESALFILEREAHLGAVHRLA